MEIDKSTFHTVTVLFVEFLYSK